MTDYLKPLLHAEKPGIGVFTPSMPAHIILEGLYTSGLNWLRSEGFKVKPGRLTASGVTEGYRTAGGRARAEEFMELIHDPDVGILMANIGGSNSASMLPWLDYDAIRQSRKLICGYSDVTSLHMAILKKARLRTCYGPALTPSFGNQPVPDPDTVMSFRQMLSAEKHGILRPPARWSDHFRDYHDGSWKGKPREYKPNPGWHGLKPGKATGPFLIANLNTLQTLAGTPWFPDTEGRILILEEMQSDQAGLERRMTQLLQMGILEGISGLVFSKVEQANGVSQEAMDTILLDVCEPFSFPVVSGFDCGHTTPMISLCQQTSGTVEAAGSVVITLDEPMVEAAAGR